MTRRMTVIVLALVGLMVFVVTISPPDRGAQDRSATPPERTATSTAPLTDPDAFDVSETLSAAPGTKPRTVQAEIGDRVELIVQGTQVDSVALGDLAMKNVEPGVDARFELLADTAGAYPVVLVNENRRIGTLEVR